MIGDDPLIRDWIEKIKEDTNKGERK